MAITAITIENFKGIKNPVRVELKPITLLFGPNSAGKSTVVQALHYVREIFERHNLNPDRTLLGGNSMDLGGFESIVYQHDLSLPIRFKLELDLVHDDLPRYLEGYEELGLFQWEQSDLWGLPSQVNSAWVQITIKWSELLKNPLLTGYEVGINGEPLATIRTNDDGKQISLADLVPFNPIFLGNSSKEEAIKSTEKLLFNKEPLSGEEIESLGEIFLRLFDLLNSEDGVPGITKNIALAGQQSALPNWGMTLKFHPSMWQKDVEFEEEGTFIQLLSSLITGPGEMVRDALHNFCYVGPLREVPKRGHRPSMSPEGSRWSSGLAAYDFLYFADVPFIEKVNHWLSSDLRLNSGYSIELKKYRELDENHPFVLALQQNRLLDEDNDFREDILNLPIKRRLLIRDQARNVELEPQDIGVGISQVLPVVVAALHQVNGLVAIEQPELHIHPALQVVLADLFIEQTRENPNQIFILETHSEHLLLRMMRRIRETSSGSLKYQDFSLEKSQIGVWFVELMGDRTIVREMPINDHGELIKAWPGGFFEESLEEIF